MEISVTVNGIAHTHDVEPRTLLVHYIREQLGLTGTNIGCDTSSCGACTIHIDGESVKSCTVLAVQADGARHHHDRGPRHRRPAAPDAAGVHGEPRPAVRLLHARHGDGRDRPARGEPHPTEQEVRIGLEGNLCRCTGYHNIVQAVLAARRRRDGGRHDRHRSRRADRRDRPAPAAPGGPRPAHRRGQVHQRPRRPRRAAPRRACAARTPTPASPSIDTSPRPRAARRRRRVHRRRPRRRCGPRRCRARGRSPTT